MNEQRLSRVRRLMEEQGLEQIIVSATASVYYLTGLWVSPMERMLALYITQKDCVLYANELFGLEPQPGLELILHSDGDEPTAQLSRRLLPGKLGVDKFWPSKFLIALLEARGDLVPVQGSAPVDQARMYKDAQEIEAMRRASQVNDMVMEQVILALKEGAKEREIAALAEELYRQNGGDRGEGLIVSFGANCADPHHGPGDAVMAPGDSVVLDLFMPIGRYWCDMTRTVFFRQADEEQRRVYQAVLEANLAAEALLRPGVPLRQVDRAARQVIEEAGYGSYFTHRLGHGCGLECHEPPDNSAASQAVAQPGMVFSVEPGIYLPGRFGVRIEDLVLLTEDGCEVLNKLPKTLQIIE